MTEIHLMHQATAAFPMYRSASPRLAASAMAAAWVIASVGLAAPGQDTRPADDAATFENPPQSESAPPKSLWHWQSAPLTEPLVTDRPDFTESVPTVPRG